MSGPRARGPAPGSPPGPPAYNFVRGAALLAAASLISRLLGGLVRIPLTRLLGGENVGILAPAYVLFGLAITFAVSGLCVATSRIVAEFEVRDDRRGADRALGVALLLGLGTGLAFWLLLDRGSAYLATEILGHAQTALVPAMRGALRAVAPAVLPVSLMSAFKGYFQGRQDMAPTSQAQVVEQVVRVAAMIWLVYALLDSGPEKAVAGAAFGNVVGATAALALLAIIFFRTGRRTGRPPRAGFRRPAAPAGRTMSRILGLALPVTLGAAFLPVMDAMQTFLIPTRLQAGGLDPGQAIYLYGQLHFMAYPLASLPAIAATAMAAALVPAITEAVERGQQALVRSRTAAALRITVLFGLPAAVGLAVLAQPICRMLYGIPEAGVPLAYVSAACLLISIQQTTSGVLQGLGFVSVPTWGLLAGLLANTAATYYLTAMPTVGINGAALGIVAAFGAAAAVNVAVLAVRTKMGFDLLGTIVRPGLATVAMAWACLAVFGRLAAAGAGNTAATVVAVTAGMAAYGVFLILVGGLRAGEAALIPFVGPRLVRLLERLPRW